MNNINIDMDISDYNYSFDLLSHKTIYSLKDQDFSDSDKEALIEAAKQLGNVSVSITNNCQNEAFEVELKQGDNTAKFQIKSKIPLASR